MNENDIKQSNEIIIKELNKIKNGMKENNIKIIEHLLKAKNEIDEAIDPLENRFNLDKSNDPKEGDSLAQLISKLSYTVNQMWTGQDVLYRIRFMTKEQFLAEYGSKPIELHDILKRACDLNVQRANLMDAIDKEIMRIKAK